MINKDLKNYIENNIFKEYSKNEEAHGLNHIKFVIKRSLDLSKDKDLNINMIYTIAAYHDIGHHIDAKNHEAVSAKILLEDENLKKFFNEEEITLMKEAVEDHRASLKREPRSIYGKVVSSADRGIDVDEALRRCYFYRKKHYPELNNEQIIEDTYEHLNNKYGEDGYANFFLEDKKYEDYLKEIRNLIKNKEEFIKRNKKIIEDIEKK